MPDVALGGFELNGRGYRFQSVQYRLNDAGSLFIDAKGRQCGLRLIGVPFPGATTALDLVGRIWEPDDEALSWHADVFAEGGLEAQGRHLWIMRGRIKCVRYDADRKVLSVSFRLQIRDGDYGKETEADGMAHGTL